MSKRRSDKKRKAIFLLPNLITTASLICGVLAILYATSGNYAKAAVLILIGAAIDGLDGTIARITRTSSAFGLNYDSLADLVTFGVAPGILFYNLFNKDGEFSKVIMAASLLYIVCGALRLAKYNVIAQDPARKKSVHFCGLPIPLAAGLIASMVLVPNRIGLSKVNFFIVATSSMFIAAAFMVSSLRFINLKRIFRTRNQNFELLVLAVMVFTFALMAQAHLFEFLFVIAILYTLSGPAIWFVETSKRILHKRSKNMSETISAEKSEKT